MKQLKKNMTVVCLSIACLGATVSHANERYIVKFKEQRANEGRAILALEGLREIKALASDNAVVTKLDRRSLTRLKRVAAIEYIEPDAKRYPQSVGEITPYGINMVNAPAISDSAAASRTVCIIDSGYRIDHEDLPAGANVSASPDGGAGDPYSPLNSHGTHVAGTIAALSNGLGVLGVLPSDLINLHIVRVFNDVGNFVYASDLVGALDECVENGANIVNMSLGGPQFSITESRAFRNVLRSNILSVAAAGNDGTRARSYPASYSSVISVAAIDSAKQHAAFSQQNRSVELAAPGVAVRSTVVPGTGFDERLAVDGTAYEAAALIGSASATGSGPLVSCGIGDMPCPGGSGQVCLIERGQVSFADKVNNCAAGGGVAAVIYNNSAGLFVGTLGGVATTIPAVSIAGDDASTLLSSGIGETANVTTLGGGDYAFFDGTSMATPHVAGVAALVWSHHLDCSASEIRAALTETAEDIASPGKDRLTGYGLVNASEAKIYLDNNGC